MARTSFLPTLRGRLARRLSVLSLAAAFALAAGGELAGQVACAHHAAPRPASASAGHHGHGAEADAPAGGEHGEHDAPCTCIGACHATAAAPLPPVGAVVAAPTALPLDPPIAPPADEAGAPRILLRLLPFPNGPPRLA